MVVKNSIIPKGYSQCISCQDLFIKLDRRVPAFLNTFIQFLIKFFENTFYKYELVFLLECKIAKKVLFGLIRWFHLRLQIKWKNKVIYDSGYLPLSFGSILAIMEDIWAKIQSGKFDKSLT